MELVSSQKLESVADFLADDEVFGIAPCSHFNNSLTRNRVNVPCDIGDCEGNCPFYSKDNFLNWIKKPTKKLSIREVKRPKERDFSLFLDTKGKSLVNYKEYAEALERYCTDLENIFANLEYDLDNAECENKALLEKLSKIRDVLDEGY